MVEDSGGTQVPGVRVQVSGKKTKKLQPVEDLVCSEAVAGNTACRAEALEAKAGTLKPPSKPCNSGLALGTRFSRFQFFVIGVCVLHLTQFEVIIAGSQDIS